MKKNILLLMFLMAMTPIMVAQNANEVEGVEAPKTLFEYPQAPDTIMSFQDRANYVVIRFWNKFDLSKPIKDEAAFEQAFQDYLDFFPYAHKTVVVNSVRDLMNKAQSNKVNFELLGRLAERNMYANDAIFPSDEAYLPFAEAMVKSKSIKKKDREYYAKQIAKINQNAIGASCPELEVVTVDGERRKLSKLIANTMTILFFNDGDCIDCMISKLKLSTSVPLNNLIAQGKVKVVCITPKKYTAEWAADARGWASNWDIVASEDAMDVFDIRISPSVFVLDEQKCISHKNITVEMLLR